MTAAGIWRPLSPIEKTYADREVYIGLTMHTAGRLDLDALETAYDAVCRSYPQLTARVKAGDGGPIFMESGGRPEVRISDGDAENPLNATDLDQRRALSALYVVRDGAAASVTLATHHSAADGLHGYAVLAEMWSCYTDAVHGAPIDLPRRPFPRSPEDLLAERGLKRSATAEAAASRSLTVPGRPAHGEATVVRHPARHRLTAAQTAALTEFCHHEHITVHGLLSGAMLLAEAEIRNVPLTDIVYRCVLNLRNRVSPAIGQTEGTTVSGISWFAISKDVKPDVVSTGRAVSERIQAGLADGSIQRSLLDMTGQQAADAKPPVSLPPIVSISNLGIIPPPRTPDDLVLTNSHGSPYARPAPGAGTAVAGYVARSFGGRLGIELYWPEADAEHSSEQSKRLDCLRELLNRVTPPS